tara:strand:- start:480 stop:1076 length:597 start_codon:yes stop_codon:yes gene_type:complete
VRGFFGIGVECVSKSMNVGSLFRSAHAFGAGFVFTVDAQYDRGEGRKADTSGTPDHVPFYSFPDVESLVLPARCELVGIELVPDSWELPSFRHPNQAAYVLGPERGSLSPAIQARCAYIVQIPTKFCVNVGIAGAIVMYDRVISLGKYPRRPVTPGGPLESLPKHVFGGPSLRRKMDAYRADSPLAELDEYLETVSEL